jgi:iron complex transport system ATP-binding protein
LRAAGATLRYDLRMVSRDLDVRVPAGGFTVIVGPNACGRFTPL